MTRREEMWWEIGQLLEEVAANGLAQDAGYADFAVYAKKVLRLGERDARVFRRVSRQFSRDVAARFGREKLSLLLDYLESSPEIHWARDPLRVEIPIRPRGGRPETVPFAQASVRELRRAAKFARTSAAATDPRLPPDVGEARDQLADALSSKLGTRAPHVKIHRSLSPETPDSLAIIGIVPSNMVAVGRALIEEGKRLRPPQR